MSNPVPEPSKKRAGGKAMKWNRAARNVRKCFVVFQCQTFITDPIQFARDLTNVWLANCYFSQDSSGFSVLLRFFDAQSGRSFHPFHRRPGSVARSWRGPFPRCGVASAQAPDPDLESLPETISEFTRVGPGPRWLDGAPGASHSSAPFRNRSEAFDTAWRSQSLEQAKVPDAVLPGSPPSARPERSERRTHPCGSRNEAT